MSQESPIRHGMTADALMQDVAHQLKYSLAKDRYSATDHDRYLAACAAVRDRIVERWIETQQAYHRLNVKRVYYLSLEFLMGRSLQNNIVNLGLEESFREGIKRLGLDPTKILDLEVDAGLGNGGLGRLAACFLDSLATLGYPAMGYGLRYEFGIFRQAIRDGMQVEEPDNWLRLGHPWEYARPEYMFQVPFGGRVASDPGDPLRFHWTDAHVLLGMPYDIPVVGFRCDNINTLRLWSAKAGEEFDFEDFSKGDYAEAVESKVRAESLTKVLYPDDRRYAGRELRLRQQYFLVSCTLQDILRRHKNDKNSVDTLPDKVAIQLNDTHPSLAVAEMMRLLVDREGVPWDHAWELTRATMAYTNHTLLAEALEQWPVEMIERLLPRHLQIIEEINRRFLAEVARRWPGDEERVRRMSLIGEEGGRRVRMANLATVGSHSINGVSAIHTELVKSRLLPDFHAMYPERFNNKTNGVTPRRWLRMCNPDLSALITEWVGNDGWPVDLERLKALEGPAGKPAERERFLAVKAKNKEALAHVIHRVTGAKIDPASLYDVHIKRLHEYKRQLLNILHVALLWMRIREEPGRETTARTFLFGAKAAPAYDMAKRIIRLIHAIGAGIERDPAVRGRLRVVFLPDYRVSMAEKIIPAADLSEQVSTAGSEASGTGNMKFALNGALTMGTLDGANIEILEAVGEENIFIFGMHTEEVEELRRSGRNRGWEVYHEDDEIRRLIDFVFSPEVTGASGDFFDPIRQSILVRPDPWMVLADLRSYAEAQERAGAQFRDRHAWAKKAMLNVARVARFSSDRTIHEYAKDIWGLTAVPIDLARKMSSTMMQFKKSNSKGQASKD